MTTAAGIRRKVQRDSDRLAFDVRRVREDFPILKQRVNGRPLVFLDSAASAQKPRAVIRAVQRCYEREYANIHRGVYFLSERATELFEGARAKVQRFLGAREAREIVFVRGATEAINLVAQTYGRKFLNRGDEVVISTLEHHSNIVPWQMLRDEKGLTLRIIPIDDSGALRMEEYEKLLGARTKLVAVTQCSNALGTITPIKEIIRLAHEKGIPVLVDGCQAVPHMPVDVRDLDCDFYVFSGHKLYGPSGIGVLYGKAALLEAMPPYQGGGDMISTVTFEKTEYNVIPTSSRPVRPISPAPSASAPPSITWPRWASTRSSTTNKSCSSTPPRPFRKPIPCAFSEPSRTRSASCRSSSKGCTPTTSARSSTTKGSPSVPGITAHSR